MTDTSTRNRQPKGVSVGGQFATETKGESGLSLGGAVAPAGPRFTTEPMLYVGGTSPWGEIGAVERLADGIEFASTADHGGYKLSDDRNLAVPPVLRNQSGWYQEDEHRFIVEHSFPVETGVDPASSGQGIKDYFPDEWTKLTGETLTPADSRELRGRQAAANEAAWRRQNEDKFIAEAAWSSGHDFELPGYTQIAAKRAADGTVRTYVMPNDDRIKRTPFLVDDHAGEPVDITDIVNESSAARAQVTTDDIHRQPGAPITDLGLDETTLPASKRDAVAKDLDKRWRFNLPGGKTYVATLREHLATYGTRGKSEEVKAGNTRRSYNVNVGGAGGHDEVQVSKTTYDALTNVPDLTTDYGRIWNDRAIEMNQAERARTADPGYGSWAQIDEARREAKAKAAAHQAKAAQLWEQMRPFTEAARAERAQIMDDTTAKVRARLGMND